MKIKTADLNEIKTLVSWAAKEGWNPGLNDAECYALADSEGFLVAYLDKKMVASISAIKYQRFAFIGFYIVKPEYRGKGLGWQLWQHTMNQLNGFNVALDGVVEQQNNYKKSGFKWAHNNIRYQWLNQQQKTTQHSESVETTSDAAINNYLQAYFPARRDAFNQAWQQQTNAQARLIRHGDSIKAYGVIRRCQDGYKIGPLFAENKTLASQLLNDLCTQADIGAYIYLDVPEPNHFAQQIMSAKNAEKVFETARMYTASEPDIGLANTYGITSFEVG